MGRVAKKAPETPKIIEDLAAATVTQTRARRTPKPNPKYLNDSVVILAAKVESSESNGSTDIEDKLPESKIVKSTKKVISKVPADETNAVKVVAARGKATIVKKQKIDFDDDEEKTKDADEVPVSPVSTPIRSTRSAKGEDKGEIKVGDDSVAIIDVSSIIAKGPTTKESPKLARGRKRQAIEPSDIIKEDDSPKKKKEEDKPSLITARKSYMPASKKHEEEIDEEIVADDKDVDVKTPLSTIKTRRNASTPQSVELEEKKGKIEVIKSEQMSKSITVVKAAIGEPKKLPMLKKEPITKVSPIQPGLPTKMKVLNNVVTTPSSDQPKPAPRLLNSMMTPKGAKLSPNVKLAGDGTDKKVFSIEMSDGSLVEKKQGILTSPVKTPSSAIKENVAITTTKPQPSVLLKNKLESELNRMKASANLMKRQMIPQMRQSFGTTTSTGNIQTGARRITKFESWYVIDVKNQDITAPIKHTHTHSLIRIGNKIKEIQLPSSSWDYKVTLQKRLQKKQNNNDEDADEIYMGEIDKANEAERHNLEPNSILFKRSHRDNNKTIIDRSLMLKQNAYAITMNGKQCQLAGAPDDIKSIEDLETLIKIIDSCSANHSCVESS